MSLRSSRSCIWFILLWVFLSAVVSADIQNIPDQNLATSLNRSNPELIKESVPGGFIESNASIVDANNRFSYNLFRSLSNDSQNTDRNLFFSPFSILSAFALTFEGARGTTADEISAVFYFPKNDSVRRAGYLELNREFNTGNVSYVMKNGNALWVDNSYPVLPGYISIAEQYYGSNVTNLDFQNKSEESEKKINSWIEERTDGKIKDLVQPGSLSPSTKVVITNAIYFKGSWASQFDANLTTDEMFNSTPDTRVPVRMMHKTGNKERYNYMETADLQVLELPYAKGTGNELSMIILLPRTPNLTAVEKLLNPQDLAEIKKNLIDKEVDIQIPKFQLNEGYSFTSILSNLGMPTAFSDKADFSGIDGTGNISLSDVFHKSFIDVNEEGTEAAAATEVALTLSIAQKGDTTPVFRADHPFIFLIQDKENGVILFAGRVMNPVAE